MTPGFWGWGGGVGPTLPDLRVQTGVFAQAHFPSSVLKHSGGTWCFSVTLTTFGDKGSFLAGQEVKSLTSFHTLVSYLLQRNSLPLSKIFVDFGGDWRTRPQPGCMHTSKLARPRTGWGREKRS